MTKVLGKGGRQAFAVAAAIVFAILGPSARAQQTWDTLPDGRVVIQVFGERLAFDPKDKDIVNDQKPEDASARFESSEGDHYLSMSLKQVIENRQAAEDFFTSATKNKVSDVRLILNFYRENLPEPRIKTQFEGMFLGKFPFSDVLGLVSARGLIYSIAPNAVVKFRYIHEPSLPPFPPYIRAIGPDQFGITAYIPEDRGELKPGKPYLDETFYVIPQTRRQQKADKNLLVGCSGLNTCSISEFSQDRKVAFSYAFQKRIFPEAEWFKLDDTLRHLAAHIFIDRTPGDFQ